MPGNFVRRLTLVLLAATLVVGGTSGAVVAVETTEDETEDGPHIDPGYDETRTFGDLVKDDYAGSNVGAAGENRGTFLQAKKAFHEARQEIQAIKKGDESPVEDVPTFFDSEDEDDGDD